MSCKPLFLNVKLPYLEIENDKRRSIARRYLSEIRNDKIILPLWDLSDNHVFFLFVIRTNNRQNYKTIYWKTECKLQFIIQFRHTNKSIATIPWAVFSYYRENAWWSVEYTVESVLSGEEVDFIITALNTK
jgi:dTDP-4-amino-4,6-dideoxygalactose transaminase